MKKTNTQKGITLIALIITIVVLLILAVVTINAIQGDGIIRYAQNAANDYTAKANEEQDNLDTLLGQIEGSFIEEKISIETNCLKYYADVDGDKEPDGVIYIDKANTKSGSWNYETFSYTITNVTTGLKEYYISKESHTTTEFGTAPVLSKVPGSTGEERFYVMALEDVNEGTKYCWYYAAYDYAVSDYTTSTGIGAGKTNTETMIAKWNEEAYGAKNNNETYLDMWGIVKEGWYVPSLEEWFAFGSAVGLTSNNFEKLGFGTEYWSSEKKLYVPMFYTIVMDGCYYIDEYSECYVRLGATF